MAIRPAGVTLSSSITLDFIARELGHTIPLPFNFLFSVGRE